MKRIIAIFLCFITLLGIATSVSASSESTNSKPSTNMDNFLSESDPYITIATPEYKNNTHAYLTAHTSFRLELMPYSLMDYDIYENIMIEYHDRGFFMGSSTNKFNFIESSTKRNYDDKSNIFTWYLYFDQTWESENAIYTCTGKFIIMDMGIPYAREDYSYMKHKDNTALTYCLTFNGMAIENNGAVSIKMDSVEDKNLYGWRQMAPGFSTALKEYKVSFTKTQKQQSPTQNQVKFRDVVKTAWYYEEVVLAYNDKYISGMGKDSYGRIIFKPEASLKLSEGVKMAFNTYVNANDLDASKIVRAEKKGEKWYTRYMEYAKNQGWFSFIPAAKLNNPECEITREEFVALIVRALGGRASHFYNVPDIHTKFEPELRYAYEIGIVNGKNGNNFCPNDKIKRAEAAAILVRINHFDKRKDNSALMI